LMVAADAAPPALASKAAAVRVIEVLFIVALSLGA
jgi:hypothetical protein